MIAARRIVPALVLVLGLMGAREVRAAMAPMGMPITTTIVISKPSPEQLYGDKQIVTMGVGSKEYKFILEDAYVDTASDRVKWPDIWEQVRIYRPNFVMQGPNTDEIENLKPGEELTIKGMYAPMDRTFEIIFVQAGKGVYEPKKSY